MPLITPHEDGVHGQIDEKRLATALGFTQRGHREKLYRLGFKHVWLEARRIASARTGGTDATVTDADLLNASRSVLK